MTGCTRNPMLCPALACGERASGGVGVAVWGKEAEAGGVCMEGGGEEAVEPILQGLTKDSFSSPCHPRT